MPVVSFDARSTIAGTNTAVNTFHVSCTAQPNGPDATSLLAPFKAFYDALVTYRALTTNVIIGSRVLYFQESWWTKPTFDASHNLLTRGYFNTEPIIIGATPASSTVGTGGSQIPPQLASVVSWRTATSGRSGRGRTYLGNLSTNTQSGPTCAPAFVTATNNAAATLITAVAAVTSIAGPFLLAVWSPTKGLIRPVLTGASDATFDTMRSRVK